MGADFFTCSELNKALAILQKSEFGIQVIGESIDVLGQMMIQMAKQNGLKKVISFMQILDYLANHAEFRILNQSLSKLIGNAKHNKRVSEINQYLFENFGQDISLDDIVELMGMTKSAFCHFFKKYSGCSFTLRLNQILVNQACHFLVNSEISVTQICFECGFQSISHFNKNFKEITGFSPSEYRKEFHT